MEEVGVPPKVRKGGEIKVEGEPSISSTYYTFNADLRQIYGRFWSKWT